MTEERIAELEKRLTICENKFEQIQFNMEHYEKWYVDLLTKATKTVEEIRKFLADYTNEDIDHLRKIVEAVHGYE